MTTDSTNPELLDDGSDRRAFLKRMAAVGFAVPVVASFSMLSSTPAFAQTLCSGNFGNSNICVV